MGSSTRRREAFDSYWALGRDRSIPRLQAELQVRGWRVSLRTLYGWSSQDAWQEQIAELDRKAWAAGDAERIAAQQRMNQGQAAAGAFLTRQAFKALKSVPIEEYTLAFALGTLVAGARMERTARGAMAASDPAAADPG